MKRNCPPSSPCSRCSPPHFTLTSLLVGSVAVPPAMFKWPHEAHATPFGERYHPLKIHLLKAVTALFRHSDSAASGSRCRPLPQPAGGGPHAGVVRAQGSRGAVLLGAPCWASPDTRSSSRWHRRSGVGSRARVAVLGITRRQPLHQDIMVILTGTAGFRIVWWSRSCNTCRARPRRSSFGTM